MSKIYKKKSDPSSYKKSILIGIAVSFLLFLAIPLLQIFTSYEKAPEYIETLEMAPPPPPPPPEEPPPPPEPEEEEPPPELESDPPPLSLEQLDMALEPGTGGSLAGDFALPDFDAKKANLGMDLFDISDLDFRPGFRRPPLIKFPPKYNNSGIEGYVLVTVSVDEYGDVYDIVVEESTHKLFETFAIDGMKKSKFNIGMIKGKAVKFRAQLKIPFRQSS